VFDTVPFDTVLIANRGEIALRIARTCREMGIRTVAVCSTADRDSAVARFADSTVVIGPAPARRSYLNAASIIEAALSTGAQAVHPGYGFLSEDPDFAEICEAYGITFLGPRAAVLARLGDKTAACELMEAAGLPVLAGVHQAFEEPRSARAAADMLGYPVILKPAAGGGGKGMQVVYQRSDFDRAYLNAAATAQAAFGDGRIYLESFVEGARHVEVQVLADGHGTVLHLGTRDCSVQRRHQKLIEEAPAFGLSAATADQIGRAAVDGARAVGYLGAGTFEFLVDAKGEFRFMEINCRIQVEHPVTELVTGIDLVREQILVGAGLPLAFGQDDVALRGVAVECRVNTENADRDFMPTPGRLDEFAAPGGPFTRVDSHAFAGMAIPPDYDSLLAKVAVWAPDREQAIARMDRALSEVRVSGRGVHTTVGFLREVLAHPVFRAGEHTTGLVGRLLDERQP
jgi:acetyl-CoA carboxylase biotin carboxylase subunit